MADETTTGETQADEMPPETYQPMRAAAEADGFVGGESHDSYGVFAVEGQRLTVSLKWDESEEFDDNVAGVGISEGGETFTEESPAFTTTEGERESTTSGTAPRTGLYTVSVTAHPAAAYRLRVTLE